jgi:hypothetical protein
VQWTSLICFFHLQSVADQQKEPAGVYCTFNEALKKAVFLQELGDVFTKYGPVEWIRPKFATNKNSPSAESSKDIAAFSSHQTPTQIPDSLIENLSLRRNGMVQFETRDWNT